MTQVYKDPQTGEEHEFPDDATPQEIDSATKGYSIQNQSVQIPRNSSMQNISNEIGGFNEKFKNYVANPALGFVQGTANSVPGMLNLLKHFGESEPLIKKMKEEGKYNLPDVPYFDVAEHTLPTQAGEVGSVFAGGWPLLKGATRMAENALSKASHYFSPEKTSQNFISQLGKGKTIPENINELSNRIRYAHQTAKEEAITPKREFMKEASGKYIGKEYPETHYPQSKTVEQADKRMSDLKYEIRELKSNRKKRGLSPEEKDLFGSYEKELSDLQNHWSEFIQTLPEKERGKYKEFTTKYAINVAPYEDASVTIRNLKNNDLKNVTATKITNAFSFPELKPQVQKILKDIGPEGINNIIFNDLGRAKNAEHALKIIEDLERNKGFSPHITPEIRKFTDQLRMQLRNKKLAKWAGYGTAGALGTGALFEAGENALRK